MQNKRNTSLIPLHTRSLVRVSPGEERAIAPAVTLTETPASFVLTFDVPGADRSSISVQIEAGVLKVNASIKEHHKTEARLHRSELVRRHYYREITILDGVDIGSVDAVYDNGVLTITFQKTESFRTREIPIS